MTLQELHERIGWQIEGRLQTRYENNWIDVKYEAPPSVCDPPEVYRRRPNLPPMPDEVWAPDYECLRGKAGTNSMGIVYATREACINANYSATPVRYVRAGAVIPASQIEWQDVGYTHWNQLSSRFSYRIKP